MWIVVMADDAGEDREVSNGEDGDRSVVSYSELKKSTVITASTLD